jgi:circadian clock protein KaiC
MYLVQGEPGVGKTTLALQFLLEGQRRGERGLYVTLSETREELHAVAAAHGWSLGDLAIFELAEDVDAGDSEDNTLYLPSEVELGERAKALLAEVDRVKPVRMVVDSCTELRLLSQGPLRFRRQLLGLKSKLFERGCSLLMLDPEVPDGNAMLQSLVHGVIHLEQRAPLFGSERRRIRVIKMREVAFRGGYHDIAIRRGGVVVFPRLVAAEHHEDFERESLPSGVAELDRLLGGGIDRGSSTLFMGPAGSGKSTLTCCYAVESARRGEHVACFVFDEAVDTMFARADGLGMPLRRYVEQGDISIQPIDPAELSPGEFTHSVRAAVENQGARMVVIDSLNGLLHAMNQEQLFILQLHELLSYLRQRGVATLLVEAQHGFIGAQQSPVDVSYLADSVVLLRFFEAGGCVRRAVSVLKKRSGRHENTIRELSLAAEGIQVGPPITRFTGILTGALQLSGALGDEPRA